MAAQTQVETTYAVNLTTGAVTTLLLGGFDKLMTAHGRLYGLKNGELTRLEGDIAVSYTHLDVYKRQVFDKVLNSTRHLAYYENSLKGLLPPPITQIVERVGLTTPNFMR